MNNKIFCGDNIEILKILDKESISLIYIDPPFNTGKIQQRKRTKNGEELAEESQKKYDDVFEDFEDFLMKRIEIALPALKRNGSIFIHLNYNEVHYIKVAMDKLLGKNHFINEIIYCWDYGGKSKKKWSQKHDTILWYAKDPKDYIFNYENIDRIPYKSPGLIKNTCKNYEEKLEKGKVPTSVWDIGIVHTMSKENCRYPTQKPLKLLNRIINVHSNPGDIVLDFFAGSGSFGKSAIINNRNFILIDKNQDAIETMKSRFKDEKSIIWEKFGVNNAGSA